MGWMVLGILALVLVLLGFLPLGADVAWNGELSLAVRVGFFSLRLGERKPSKTKDEPKTAEEVPPPEKEKKKRRLPPMPLIRSLLHRGYRLLCGVLSHAWTDRLRLHFTAAFSDPALTAMAYGAAGTAMDGLLHVGGKRIRHPDLWAEVDFDSGTPSLDLRFCFVIRLGLIVTEAVRFGFGFLKDFLRYKKQEGRKSNGKSSDR